MSLQLLDLEFSSAEVRNVKRVQFGILAPEVVKAMSVCEIQHPILMMNGQPKEVSHPSVDLKFPKVFCCFFLFSEEKGFN